jgi:hypothetical protein
MRGLTAKPPFAAENKQVRACMGLLALRWRTGWGVRPGHPLLIDRREHVEERDEVAAGDPT